MLPCCLHGIDNACLNATMASKLMERIGMMSVADTCVCHAQRLLAEVEAGHWETLARRRVKHYGYQFHYVVRLSIGLACSLCNLISQGQRLTRRCLRSPCLSQQPWHT